MPSWFGAQFPILIDPAYAVGYLESSTTPEIVEVANSTRAWQINNFPTHIFIDREGIVRAVVLKPMDYDTAVAYGEMILDSTSSSGASPFATPPR